MPFVKTLFGAEPRERSDGVPFTKAIFQTGPAITGPWTTRATITIETGFATPAGSGGILPVGNDTNPKVPLPRDVTTTQAPNAKGDWGRIVWEDAAGNQDEGDASLLDSVGIAASARDRLARMVDATTEPVLDNTALDELLTLARRRDASGRSPSDTSWTPTYDFDHAAAEGWLRKAGMTAPLADIGIASAGQSFRRSQIHAHCLAMETRYRRGLVGSTAVKSGTLQAYDAAVAEAEA